MSRYEAVIFDKDGTLFDFGATWGAWARRVLDDLAGRDAALAGRLASALGFDLATARYDPDSPAISGTIAQTAAIIAAVTERPRPEIEAFLTRRATDARAVPVAPLAPLLNALSVRGVRLALATNDSMAPTLAQLHEAGIEGLLSQVRTAGPGVRPKPHPDMLLSIAGALELAPARVLMVGDSRADIAAARAAGMDVVAVLSGPTEPDSLAGADAVIDHIGMLPGWLDAAGQGHL